MIHPRFLFGQAPDTTLLEQLGLAFPVDITQSAEQLHAGALTRIEVWSERCRRTVDHLAASPILVSAPRTKANATALLREAQRAGTRMWLGAVFNTPAVVARTVDLRSWCSLQLRVLGHIEDSLMVALVWFSGGDFLEDAQLLREARPLLSGTDLERDEVIEREQVRWTHLSYFGLHTDWEEYVMEAERLEQEGRPLPVGLRRPELQRLLRRAWAYLSPVAERTGTAPPNGPPEADSVQCCVDALTGLLGWCSEVDRGAAGPQSKRGLEDGPVTPAHFRINGEKYGEFTRGDLQLLDVLWRERRDDRYSAVEIDRLAKLLSVKKVVKRGAVLSAKGRLSRKFLDLNVPATLDESQGYLVLRIAP
jgi:hypothetical protein